MAAFRIQYVTPPGDTHYTKYPRPDSTLWVTPDGFTVQQARDSFIRQSPTVTVGSIIRVSDHA